MKLIPVVVRWMGYAKRFEMATPINKRRIRSAMSRLLGIRFVAPFIYIVKS